MDHRTANQINSPESMMIFDLRFDLENEHIAGGECDLANDLFEVEKLIGTRLNQEVRWQDLYEMVVSLGPNVLAARYLDLLVKVVERAHGGHSNNNPIA